MNAKIRYGLLTLLCVTLVGATVALFIPHSPVLPVYSLILLVVLGIQLLGFSPAAFMLGFVSVLIGVYSMSILPEQNVLGIPFLFMTFFCCAIITNHQIQKIKNQKHQLGQEGDDITQEMNLLNKDISFYESKKAELSRRGDQRKKLSMAARNLGRHLDPHQIQMSLVETAKQIFPNFPVTISYGQQPDAIESFVIQKKRGVLAPNDMFKGLPLMAVPITANQSLAGILKVGGKAGLAVTRDDFRLLEILASLASLALDNSLLFSQIQQTALRDGLTGLLTHRAFQEQMEDQILGASRFGQPLSLIMADVDHFKGINDTYGHPAGDQILQAFSHLLVKHVRDVDIVARYGGEEFVVLLLQTAHGDAVRLAESIRRDLEEQAFDVGRQMISVTASFGVSTFPEDATSGQQLIRQADQHLYKAKQAGRNRVWGK